MSHARKRGACRPRGASHGSPVDDYAGPVSPRDVTPARNVTAENGGVGVHIGGRERDRWWGAGAHAPHAPENGGLGIHTGGTERDGWGDVEGQRGMERDGEGRRGCVVCG